MSQNPFKGMFDEVRQQESYWIIKTLMCFGDDLGRLLEDSGMTIDEFCANNDINKRHLHNIFCGEFQNLTIKEVVHLLWLFDKVPQINVIDKDDFYGKQK